MTCSNNFCVHRFHAMIEPSLPYLRLILTFEARAVKVVRFYYYFSLTTSIANTLTQTLAMLKHQQNFCVCVGHIRTEASIEHDSSIRSLNAEITKIRIGSLKCFSMD